MKKEQAMKIRKIKTILLAGVLVFESIFAGIGTVNAQTVSENGIAAEESTSMDVSVSENVAVSENDVTEEVAERKNLQVQSEQAVAEKAAIKYSGTDGGVNWSIDENGHLLLTGDGDYEGDPDWTSTIYRDEIRTATVKVKNMTSAHDMFYFCENLKSVDFTGFDTSKVTDMSDMFYWCYYLEEVDFSHFDTSNVTNMSGMFSFCVCLEKLDLSYFNTSNVINMNQMFSYCDGLKELNLSSFNTSKVTSMCGMFDTCKLLTELNVSHFDTSNVTNMNYLFFENISLGYLDISTWNMAKVEDTSYMLSGTERLAVVKLPNLPKELQFESFYVDEANNITKVAKANAGKKTYRLMEYAESYCGKNGHSYSLPVFTWAPDYSSAQVYLECTREDCFFHTDHKTLKLNAVVTKTTVNPTTEKEGEIRYTATAAYNGKTYTEVKKISIPKLEAKPVGTAMEFTNTFYRVVKTGKTPELAYIGPKNKRAKKVTIPASVTIEGVTYKVTSVAAGALKNYKNLTKVTIGKNVTKIGKNAFYGCKKLKTIVIKSKKLKSVEKNALKGIKKNATIDVPNSKKKAKKKLLKSKTGYKKTMSVK